MLHKLKDIATALTKVSSEDFYVDIIKSLDFELEEYQRLQMSRGQNNEGNPIGELRSAAYARRKKASGGIAPLGQVDLRDTGDFQDSIFTKISNNFIKWGATDSKTSDLVQKYGDIFGLSDFTLNEFQEEILKPRLIKEINGVFK